MGTRSEEFSVLRNQIFKSICSDKSKLIMNNEQVIDEQGILKVIRFIKHKKQKKIVIIANNLHILNTAYIMLHGPQYFIRNELQKYPNTSFA